MMEKLRLGFSELEMASPPREIWTLGPLAVSAALMRLLASVLVTLTDFIIQVTLAKATVRSGLICAAPSLEKGLVTDSMPGTLGDLGQGSGHSGLHSR
jgi:hypothetical protein